jgi:3-oxoacyl-[acyl-carrier protein] reductase
MPSTSPKTVLVTGASRGIGRAIALRLAQDGFDIAVHCHSQRTQAETVIDAIAAQGRKAWLLMFDISDREATRQALEADIAAHGVYYGVVCNAGITADNAFPGMPAGDWDRVLGTNLDSFYNVLHPLIMPMVQTRRPGRIVTLSSISGISGNRGQVNYSAAKAGIIGATKALALELAKRKITVNCVAPGLIDTGMVSPEVLKQALPAIPVQRAGQPEEVASAVAFLMREDAAYITRQVITVDGGML